MGIIDKYLQRRGFVKAVDIEQKSAGFMADETAGYSEGRPDQDKIADYSTFVRAYSQLPWLYAGGLALAIGATKPDLKVIRETKKGEDVEQEEVTGTGLNTLVETPNPDLSYRELIQITVLNLSLVGNAFWNLVGTRENKPISKTNPPVEIWWVKPEQMQPLPDANGLIKGYEFTGPSGKTRTLDVSEVIHFRMPNPGSYFMGMGALSPLSRTATLELNAMTFQDNFLKNDGTPPFWFTNGPQDKAQRKLFWDAFDERHKGPKKANRAGMLWGEMDVKTLGGTMKDAQYIELRKMNREETLAALPGSVPPSIVGLLEYANYSNMEVQSKKFWEDCEMPILGIIADKLTSRLAPLFDDGVWFEYDFSKIKALQEDEERKARVDRIRLGSGKVTPNQLRKESGQEPYPGGDKYYMDFSLSEVGEDPKALPAPKPKESPPAKEPAADPNADPDAEPAAKGMTKDDQPASFWADPGRRKLLWDNFDKRLSAQERAFEPLVKRFLDGQADEVKAKIEAAGSPQEVRAADVFDPIVEAHLYGEKFEGRYRFAFERAGEAGYHATKGKLWIPPEERRIKDDDTFNVTPAHLAQLRAQIAKSAKFFNETTWAEVKAGIDEALAENLTNEAMAQKLWEKLDGRAAWEARRIASTEMTRTDGWGNHEGYKQNESIDRQAWNCQNLATSRDDHIEADGQEVGIDEDFTIGGEAMAWPGDQRASAGNVCNCRCSTYPVVGEL
jgi:HK97 family phage portal protein